MPEGEVLEGPEFNFGGVEELPQHLIFQLEGMKATLEAERLAVVREREALHRERASQEEQEEESRLAQSRNPSSRVSGLVARIAHAS